MKYGESAFDVLYLLFAITAGIYILCGRRDRIGRLMGFATLILGCGDAFHLVPRVLGYFIDADFTAWLGIGKLITSVTMTVFYVLMYRLWIEAYGKRESKALGAAPLLPILGMLMLPKTVCYMILIGVFLKYTKQARE